MKQERMQIKKGIPVSPGVAISQAVVIDAEDVPVPRRTVPPIRTAQEHERLEQALGQCRRDIETLRQHAQTTVGDLARIFDFHLGVLQDQHLIDQIKQLMDRDHVTAEYAVFSVMRKQAHMLQQQTDNYLSERQGDIWDIERRILGHLIGRTRAHLSELEHEAVVVAHDLTPSQTASLDKSLIKAIVTDAGGPTSHTAILAHGLGIPAIVGLEDLTLDVNSGDQLIIDANQGFVIINPVAAQLMEYRVLVRRMAQMEISLDELARLPAVTKNGTEINIEANIEFPSEIQSAIEKGATGIGLYRTEFLYLASDFEPTEEQHYEAYMEAIHALKGRPLTIRTLDLGADKVSHTDGFGHSEPNPFLGCRSIRLCLQNLPLFKRQLRAILRASASGPVRMMFPLISNVMELRQAKMITNDVMEDLDEEGVSYDPDISVGIMVEVPSAALQAKLLSAEADFFSIGTNDLIQYTLAVDRGNERIASLYSASHPAVIHLIKEVVRTANRTKTSISLCGEMAGEPEFVMLLLGIGLTSLSVTPPAILEVKKMIRSVTLNQCQRVARRVSSFDSDREVLNYLRDVARKFAPDVIDNSTMQY